MIAQLPAPVALVPALPDIAPSVGHFVLLVNHRTGEERIVEVWSETESFADVCRELNAVRADLGLPKSEWSFDESWPIDAPF